MARKYMTVADGGMSGMAGHNNRKAQSAPQSQDRGDVPSSIPCHDFPYTNACSMPPRIDVLFQ